MGLQTILGEAPVRAREALDRDDRFGSAVLTLFVTFTHLAHDQPEEALRFLDARAEGYSERYDVFHVWNAIRRTHALLYMGEAQQARLHMQREYRRFRASVLSRTRFYRVTMQSLGDGSALVTPSWGAEP